MESPSHFFSDCLVSGGGDTYPIGVDADRRAQYDYDRLSDFSDRLLDTTAFPGAVKSEIPRSSFCGRVGDIVGMEGVDDQPLYIDPNLCSDGLDAISELPFPGDHDDVLSEAPEPDPELTGNTGAKHEAHRASKSASSTDVAPANSQPPRKRKQRKIKGAANALKDEERRTKFLERNRIAASKCREKKKQYMSELEGSKSDMETQNAQLHLEYNRLLAEVGQLKHRLMGHANCNDPNIDSWLAGEARRFVRSSNDGEIIGQGGGILGGALGGAYHAPAPPSSHARNASTAPNRQSTSYNPLDIGGQPESIAYSLTSSTQASPTDLIFPLMGSPTKLKSEPSINYDHMPDNMLCSE